MGKGVWRGRVWWMAIVGGHRRGAAWWGVLGGMPLKRAKQARKGVNGAIGEEEVGIMHGVPQHASLFNPIADVPSPTSSVPIFSLD